MSLIKNLKVGLLFSSVGFLAACAEETAQTAPQPPQAPVVSVAPVIYERLTEWDEFTGRLESPESVELRPRVSGYIESVAFKEGSIVQAGKPLFYIDSKPFEAEIKRLEADMIGAQSQLKLAEINYNRARTLTSKNTLSKETRDNRFSEMEQAKANVQSLSAALDLAKLNLSYTQVVAPITGRVSRAEITTGNYVTAGQSVLTSIVSINPIYAYFDADEQTYLKYVKLAKQGTRPSSRDVKNPVYMALANEQGYSHEGYIDFVDNQVNPATGTIRGRAVFNNHEGTFIPGLFARIKLVGSATYAGILVDDKAIGTDLNRKFVLVLDEKNNVQYREVTLGEKLNGLRIIKSGLTSDDRIVVKGLQRVRPGSAVSPEFVSMADSKTISELHALQQRVDSNMSTTFTEQQAYLPSEEVNAL
ncbi:efflux RND transporter periplasmic adaptor subunit [Litoribacillus peritrichatus]|uniref:Efflux RND transporter periplasmic adaptor subunit n=1 Tax=Litoribacillus peritrichatus TaxID=718191 RepID=A0ABP7M9B2_9GAMM